jgi:hypothetical protein
MRPLIIVMLCVQVAILLVTATTILFARSTPDKAKPVWSSLAISLVIIAAASWQIADRHDEDAGAELLTFGAPLLLGMGIMAILLAIRQRRRLDIVA